MGRYDQYRRQSQKMAFCGMIAALSAAILAGVSLLPLASFACLLLAMACQVPVTCEYGTGTALLVYAAVSVLAMLLCADREAALLYVFLGWYPGVRSYLTGLPRFLGAVVKCGLFSLSVVTMYFLVLYVFQLGTLVQEFAEYTHFMVALMLIMGNVVFLLFDELLGRLTRVYRKKRRRV